MTTPRARPRVVDIGFWLWLAAAVLLVVGGLITVSLPVLLIYRGTGALAMAGGLALGFLAGRSRRGHQRFRHAALALAMALVVMVALLSVFGAVYLLTLLSVLPLIGGVVAMTRLEAVDWFGQAGGEGLHGG